MPASAPSLVELLAPRAGERVLDAGCGLGRTTAQLTALGCVVTGVDRESTSLEQARLAAPDAEFMRGDLRQFKPKAPFDAVLAAGVLHWLGSIDEAAALAATWLRPGGRIAASFGGAGVPAPSIAQIAPAFARAGFVEIRLSQQESSLRICAHRPEASIVP